MAYQPKHSDADEPREEKEEVVFDVPLGGDDPLKALVAMLSRMGKQDLVNLLLVSMIEDLLKGFSVLLADKAKDEADESDPLETALAYGGADAE